MNTTDSLQVATLDSVKASVFMWEVIITIVIFGTSFFVLKKMKSNQQKARKQNEKYQK